MYIFLTFGALPGHKTLALFFHFRGRTRIEGAYPNTRCRLILRVYCFKGNLFGYGHRFSVSAVGQGNLTAYGS